MSLLVRSGVLAKQTVSGGAVDSPDDVAGLWAWHKPETLAGADGTAISQWDDSSGNSRHLVQSNASFRPTKKTAIVNGLDVARFDGSSRFLELAAATGVANPSDLTIFAVVKGTSAATYGVVSTRDGTSGWLARLTATGSLFAHIGGTPNPTDTFTSTNWNIVQVVRTGLSAVMGHNGTMASASVISAYPASSSRTTVGGEATTTSAAASTNALNGDLAELIIYSTALSSGDRDAIETYLGSKFSITVA